MCMRARERELDKRPLATERTHSYIHIYISVVCTYVLEYFYGLHFACSCDFLLRPNNTLKGPKNDNNNGWQLQNYILCMTISQRRHQQGDEMAEKREITTRVRSQSTPHDSHIYIHT